MKPAALLVALLAALAACEATGTYPITGAACGPDDPVLEMSPPSCLPPN